MRLVRAAALYERALAGADDVVRQAAKAVTDWELNRYFEAV